MNKKLVQRFLFLFGTILIVTGLIISFENKEFVLFPIPKNSNYNFQTYHEGVATNFSKSEAITTDSAILFKYKLSAYLQEPFSALFFYREDHSFIDISDYNTITLDLKAERARRIPITFTLNYEGLTSFDKDLSNLPFTKVIDYKGEGKYTINLDEFEVPSWWLRHHQLKKEDLRKIDFTRTNYIVIGSCQVIGADLEDTIFVSGITFSKDRKAIYFTLFIFGLLIYALAIVYNLISKRKTILVPYIPNNQDDSISEDRVSKITEYLASSYSNPELSLEEVHKGTGISEREIGLLIKQNFNTSFKSYLNTIRLTEVIRLLKETDLSVSEIAYKAGYNNISHFNRVFKGEFNMSPKEFREKNNGI